jgi:hypothetical protein
MIFHDVETPLCSTVHFSDAETLLCGTAHFPVAETPATFHSPPVAETPIVSNFSSVSPDAETPLFNIFHPRPTIFPTPHHR